ncbi:hypothetical protein [Candidatus Protochlamydia phocaeensis]|uniref:hypothetical protein n=1 Tax=Candidatus Protochlamydia phocaeensis TaxID=1414722 RepID=UPI000838146C|nr:hypothetical protein [Candidatus Protochlamydia phocaeensis]
MKFIRGFLLSSILSVSCFAGQNVDTYYFSTGSHLIPVDQQALVLKKVYFSPEQLVATQEGLFIQQDNSYVAVQAIYYDADGMHYLAGLYGDCPNGHPYGNDPGDGCYGGERCPHSDSYDGRDRN